MIRKFFITVEKEDSVRVWWIRRDGVVEWIAVDDCGNIIGCHKMGVEEWGVANDIPGEELRIRASIDKEIMYSIIDGDGEPDPVGPTEKVPRELVERWGWSLEPYEKRASAREWENALLEVADESEDAELAEVRKILGPVANKNGASVRTMQVAAARCMLSRSAMRLIDMAAERLGLAEYIYQ